LPLSYHFEMYIEIEDEEHWLDTGSSLLL
jgi:hypothetical protein